MSTLVIILRKYFHENSLSWRINDTSNCLHLEFQAWFEHNGGEFGVKYVLFRYAFVIKGLVIVI
jgi:hypothetical protein